VTDLDVKVLFSELLADPEPDRLDVDAAVVGGQRLRTRRLRRRGFVVGGVALAGLSLAAATLLGHSHYFSVYQPSGAMTPTIAIGGSAVIDKSLTAARTDVVQLALPNDESVLVLRRVYGFPGDTVSCPESSPGHCDAVVVNGSVVSNPYLATLEYTPFEPTTVPDGALFVLGDNMSAAVDSTVVGPFSRSSVTGVAVAIQTPGQAARPVPGAPTHTLDDAQIDPPGPVPPASAVTP